LEFVEEIEQTKSEGGARTDQGCREKAAAKKLAAAGASI